MVKGDVSTSEGDTDSSSNDFHLSEKGILELGSLQKEWETVEHYLYQEVDAPVQLKPNILHECRMWKESFPYLRVKGHRIENPLSQKRQILKQQILNLVVDQIIHKLNDGALTVQDEKILLMHKEESYFERGKKVKGTNVTSPIKPSPFIERGEKAKLSAAGTLSSSLGTNKPPPIGILKNSPNRRKAVKKAQERKIYKEPTSQRSTFRSSSLPRISSKNNNWLSRSEKHIPSIDQISHRRIPAGHSQGQTPCTCSSQSSHFILPPIKTPSELKRISR